jgi:putative Holliday junction resolvase
MRILGIDPGERRIGLAVSDELGVTAQGLDTFDTKTGGDFFDYVATLVETKGIESIVVGNPLRGSGMAGESSRRAEVLATRLRSRLSLEVTMWDERYSSQEAKRVMRAAPAKKRRQKGNVDRIAAMLILQSYLDFKRGSA